jgi:alpha-amylase
VGLTTLLAACSGAPAPSTASMQADEAGAGLAQNAAPRPMLDPEWRDEVLYFVIVDRFVDGDRTDDRNVDLRAKGTFHGGDLVGLTENLEQIAELGVTALWITPVVEQIPGYVTGAGFPDWGYHGYWADDFYAVDERFGSEADLAALVAAAHERGLKVLLDVVYNHAGYDSRYTTDPRTRHWLRTENAGTCGHDDLTQCVAGLPDFRTELPEVRDYLLEAHLGRAERAGLDGFRLDTVKHVEHDFWQLQRREIDRRLGADFFLVGEVWGGDGRVLDPYFANDEMDAGFDFGFQGSTIAFLQGRGRPVAFERYLERRAADTRDGYLLAHYLSTHDVPGALYQLGGDVARFRLAAVLQLTTWGLPTIYYGEEVARPGGDWPDNRSDMPWGDLGLLPGAGKPRDEALRDDYRRLIALRRAHPALWRGSHTGLETGEDLLVFARTDDEGDGATLVVAVNRSEEPVSTDFAAPEDWGGEAQDLWNDETVAVTDGRVRVEVPPLGARILAAAAPGAD